MAQQKEVIYKLAFLEKKVSPIVVGAALLGILLVWELLVRSTIISSLYLPAPTVIVLALLDMISTGELGINLFASLQRISLGFLLGSSLGILLGLLLGYSKLAEAVGNPIVHALYPIPKIALLPLIILWLGIGEVSKVTIIALGVFFPVLINTYSGVKHVDFLYLKVAMSFGTSTINMLKKVIWPTALPSIFAGLKLAGGTSLLLLVAAEMIAAKEGLGALILHYGDLMITNRLMAGILVLSLLGLSFNLLFDFLEKRYIRR